MKYSIIFKFIAIILCALSLLACVGGAAGMVVGQSYGLYTDGPDDWLKSELYYVGQEIAWNSCVLYNAEHLGGCPEDVVRALREGYFTLPERGWSVVILQSGQLLHEQDGGLTDPLSITYTLAPSLPMLRSDMTPLSEAAETGSPVGYDTIYVSDGAGNDYLVELVHYEGPEYQVIVSLQPDLVDSFRVSLITMMYERRNEFIAALFIGLLSFAATLVYLCCAAGRHPGTGEVYPVALNRLPLDLYAGVGFALETALAYVVIEMIEACVSYGGNWAVASLILLGTFAMALIVVAFLFACAAQLKTKGGFWWRRTLIGWCLSKFFGGLRWVGRGIAALFGMLPLVWQWLLAVALMPWVPLASFLLMINSWDSFAELCWGLVCVTSLLGDIALIAYWAYSMGQIMKGVNIMSRGGLHYQIPTRRLLGKFRQFAEAINSMAGAARLAAERHLKSERMKTELITNVSHDIKTPLTSIINYVDLMKKPHDEAQAQQYLEVLDRQSQRLKKLIGDLMEMSKASTGNIAVEMGQVDAAEAINQALGEFSDKLDAVAITPVLRCPQEPVIIRADGKLLWRVLSNLLSNAVKYAMPGTRLYIDLLRIQGNMVLNMKNISRDPLNVGVDELMERFVRGDASRNTEGSGLGLNIAKSLVELQKGQMHLMVDGDLFKVTLVMPLAGEE